MEFIPLTRALLRRPAQLVPPADITSERIQATCNELLEFAGGLTKPNGTLGKRLVGVAANQVGIDLAIAAVSNATPTEWRSEMSILINPRIVRQWGDEVVEWWHGCYSTGELVTIIQLPRYMEVEYYDRQGKLHTWVIDGVVDGARLLHVVWHEIRHLFGLRHTDKAVEERWPIYVAYDEERPRFHAGFMAGGRGWHRVLQAGGWQAMVAGRGWRRFVVNAN